MHCYLPLTREACHQGECVLRHQLTSCDYPVRRQEEENRPLHPQTELQMRWVHRRAQRRHDHQERQHRPVGVPDPGLGEGKLRSGGGVVRWPQEQHLPIQAADVGRNCGIVNI